MKWLIVFCIVIGIFARRINSTGCQDNDCAFSIANLKCLYCIVYACKNQSLIECFQHLTDWRMVFTEFKSFYNETSPPKANDEKFEELKNNMDAIIKSVLTDMESVYLAQSLKEFRICQEPSALFCKKSPGRCPK